MSVVFESLKDSYHTTFITNYSPIHKNCHLLILTSYRPSDLLILLRLRPNNLLFVQHGIQSKESKKKTFALLISRIVGYFLKPKIFGLAYNNKSGLPFGLASNDIYLCEFNDPNANQITFSDESNNVLIVDQPYYKKQLESDIIELKQNNPHINLLLKKHPNSKYDIRGINHWIGEPISSVIGYSSSLLYGLKNKKVYSLLRLNDLPKSLRDRAVPVHFELINRKVLKIQPIKSKHSSLRENLKIVVNAIK